MQFVPGIEASDAPNAALHVVVHPKGVIVRRADASGGGGGPRMLDAAEAASFAAPDAARHFLGRLELGGAMGGAPQDVVTVAVEHATREIAPPFELLGLRAL